MINDTFAKKAENIQPIHGHLVLATDAGGSPYTVYDEYEDHKKHDAKSRLILTFGRDDSGQSVVSSIKQDGATVRNAVAALDAVPMPKETKESLVGALLTPEKASFGGLEFTVGGPASGKLVDKAAFEQPEIRSVLKDAASHYENASFAKIDLVSPHVDKAAAPAGPVSRP